MIDSDLPSSSDRPSFTARIRLRIKDDKGIVGSPLPPVQLGKDEGCADRIAFVDRSDSAVNPRVSAAWPPAVHTAAHTHGFHIQCGYHPGYDHSSRNHRGRPGRAHGRLPPHASRGGGDRARGRSAARRGHLPDGRIQRFSVRYRRPPLLLEVEGSGRSVDRTARRRHARPAPQFADSLWRQVLLLSAAGGRGPEEPGARGGPAVRRQLRLGPRLSCPRPAVVRGLGLEPVRPPAVRHLLQDLHREGVGHELQGDLRRLGGAADQGAVAGKRDLERRHAPAAAEGSVEADQDTHRLVPLSAEGTGHDVGGRRAADGGAGGRDPDGLPSDRARPHVRWLGGSLHRRGGRAAEPVRRSCDLLGAAAGAGARPRAGREPEGAVCRHGAEVSRVPDRGVDREADALVRRQLDLHPRAGREGRAGAKLPQLVSRARARSGAGLLRPRILLLRGGWTLELDRCRADRPGLAGAGATRSGPRRRRRGRSRRPTAEGLSGLRRRLRPACRHDPRGAG